MNVRNSTYFHFHSINFANTYFQSFFLPIDSNIVQKKMLRYKIPVLHGVSYLLIVAGILHVAIAVEYAVHWMTTFFPWRPELSWVKLIQIRLKITQATKLRFPLRERMETKIPQKIMKNISWILNSTLLKLLKDFKRIIFVRNVSP